MKIKPINKLTRVQKVLTLLFYLIFYIFFNAAYTIFLIVKETNLDKVLSQDVKNLKFEILPVHYIKPAFWSMTLFLIVFSLLILSKRTFLSFKVEKKELKNILITVAIVSAVIVIFDFIFKAPKSSNQLWIEKAFKDPQTFWLTLFIVVILAPISEEIIYRGVLQDGLSIIDKKFSLIATTIIFAWVHIDITGSASNSKLLLQFMPYFIVSLALCYTYYKTQKLTICIYAHILFNAISTFFILFIN